jgi:hypothetical protein
MHDVRWLISRGIEALRGKRFPRRVTTVNGNTRWQGYGGRSFHTREEAWRAIRAAYVAMASTANREAAFPDGGARGARPGPKSERSLHPSLFPPKAAIRR